MQHQQNMLTYMGSRVIIYATAHFIFIIIIVINIIAVYNSCLIEKKIPQLKYFGFDFYR